MGRERDDDRRSVHGFVTGRVQGVGFRWFVLQTARASGLDGDVRNLRDGRVEFRARGRAEAVDRFLDAVRQGPPAARVDRLDVEERPYDGDDTFTIR